MRKNVKQIILAERKVLKCENVACHWSQSGETFVPYGLAGVQHLADHTGMLAGCLQHSQCGRRHRSTWQSGE